MSVFVVVILATLASWTDQLATNQQLHLATVATATPRQSDKGPSISGLPTPSWSAVDEFCEWETVNVTCPDPDHVIVVRQARYGRERLGRCVAKSYGHIGCGTDVTSLIGSACSARRYCRMSVISLHGTPTSCPSDLKAYLQLSYDCVRGILSVVYYAYISQFLPKISYKT